MGSEDYLSWHKKMKSRQRKSNRQMHFLLCQTKRLKQENEQLRAQMLASGPSQSQHPQSQQTTLRRTDEASFPRNTEFSSGNYTTQFEEELSPTHQTQLDEDTDSTPTLM